MTLDTLLLRNSYAKAAQQLDARVKEFASAICKKMQELDVKSIRISNMSIETKEIKTITYKKGFFLFLDKACLDCVNGEMARYDDDGKCRRTTGATRAQALQFLSCAQDIITRLFEIETKKTEEIVTVLENTKDL